MSIPKQWQRVLLLLPFLALSTAYAKAQSHTENLAASPVSSLAKGDTIDPYYYRANLWLVKAAWHDFKQVAAAPFHWQGRQWLKFGAITGAAGVLALSIDHHIPDIAARNQGTALSEVSKAVYGFGNRFPPFLLSGMYVTGIITHNRKLEHVSLKIAKSLAISTVFYLAAKTVIRRNRPSNTDNPYEFSSPFRNNDYTSFPSGHANTVFATATAFALEFKSHRWVPWVTYGLATLTCLSRLYDNRHWSSDVLIGASIGHFVTRSVFKAEAKRKMINKKMVW